MGESFSVNGYPKIIDELYGGKIAVVQLVLTIPNPIDFFLNYDKIGTKLYSSING